MADPRTYTVKQCPPAYAAKSGSGIGSATSTRRDFGNAIGKIGDLEILNGVAGGVIGKGLRTVASISNSIRSGCGALPTSIGSSLDAGANWILEQTGIAPTVVDALRQFNPGAANQAYGQAKAVFEQVSQGGFKFTDIPNVLQDFQNLERLGRNIFTPSKDDAQSSLGAICEASPYAIDLIARAPKFKFLFIVEFRPTDEYTMLSGDDIPVLEMAFAVKTSTRPNIKFQTEDVNYYNYRSSYVTKTTFDEMTMTFHDDIRNATTQFYTSYLKAISPIANISDPAIEFESRGMEFTTSEGKSTLDQPGLIINRIAANMYAGSSGLLLENTKTVFSHITLYHVFDYGHRATVYKFLNPRITSLSPDDLDMAGGEGSQLSITFSYDSVYVDPDVSLAGLKLEDKQRGSIYQLKYHKSASTMGPNNSGISPTGTPTSGSQSCDPMGKTNNSGTNAPSGNPAVSAVRDLAEKFSNFI